MLKRTLALVLALLLSFAALSESAYEYVSRAGYAPAMKASGGRERVCYFGEKADSAILLWTDGQTQYRLENAGDRKAMAALYLELLSLTCWDRCQYVAGGKRLYGFNAPKRARNSYPTQAQYAEAVANRICGATPVPRETPAPSPIDTPRPTPQPTQRTSAPTYVLNTNTLRFHRPDCAHVREIFSKNRQDVRLSRQEIIDMGYKPCGGCKP